MKTIKTKVVVEKEVNLISEVDFLHWLDERGALGRFVYNLMTSARDGFGDNIFDFDDERVYELIDEAFRWKSTEEGHEYWANLDAEWKKYCKDNEIVDLIWEEQTDIDAYMKKRNKEML